MRKCTSILSIILLCIGLIITKNAKSAEDLYHTYSGVGKKSEGTSESAKPSGSFHSSLYTGSAVYSYPFKVPPGTNGLKPNLSLSYSSQAAKGHFDWVGLGWSLNLSYIQRDVEYTPDDTSDDTFNLYLNGQKHDLIYNIQTGRYHTEIESYLHITKETDQWIVKSKDGMCYKFDFQVMNSVSSRSSQEWRWYLSEQEDNHGNKIFYCYQVIDDGGTYQCGRAVYPDMIEYNNDRKRAVEFVLASGPGDTVYEQGSRICETKKLKELRVLANDTLIRKYTFSYSSDNRSANLFLNSIKEFGSDGDSADAESLSTNFSYNSIQREFSDPTEWRLTEGDIDEIRMVGSNGDVHKGTLDINRDGLPDYVHPEGNTIEINFNNGDGFDDLINWSCIENYYGCNHDIRDIHTLYDDKKITHNDMFDINGDGLPDLVEKTHDTESYWAVNLNTGTGFAETTHWHINDGSWAIRIIDSSGNTIATTMDLNGDGLPDYIRQKGGCWHVYLNNGTGFNSNYISWNTPGTQKIREVDSGGNVIKNTFDINGDGLPDFVDTTQDNNDWYVYFNNGSGFDSTPFENWDASDYIYELSSDGHVIKDIFDINGDGLPDLVTLDEDNNDWNVYFNTGDDFNRYNWSTPGEENIREPWYIDVVGYYQDDVGQDTFDINGDGLPDLIEFVDIDYSEGMNYWQVYFNQTKASYLLTEITNSLGGVITIKYDVSTQFDNTGTDDISDLGLPMWVVKSITKDNQMPGGHHTSDTFTYNYEGGLYDYEDREFRGFSHVSVIKPDGTVTEHWFHQNDALKGLEYRTEIKDSSENMFKKTENSWSYIEANGIYEKTLESISQYTYDGSETDPKITKNEYDYDDYGNVVKETYLGDTGISGDERYVHKEYIYNTNAWILNKVKHRYLLNADLETVEEKWFYYDNQGLDTPPVKGDLTKEESWLDSGSNQIKEYGYDTYGNKVMSQDPRGNITQYIYGITDTTYTFPEKEINALGQESVSSYDLGTGNLLSETDPNGYTTSYEYDVFGRIIKKIKPYDSSDFPTVSYEYLYDGVAPEGVKTSKRDISGQASTIDVYKFVDGLGREVQTRSDAENPSKQVVKDTFYNETGKVEKESVPHLDDFNSEYTTPLSARATTFEYDPLGRTTLVHNPDETYRTTSYDHWKRTFTDENNNLHVHYLNAYEKIVQVDEMNEGQTFTTQYIYNARDELISITDAAGNPFSFEYDSLGRRTKMIDPDLGKWTYDYDPSGNMISKTDNRNIIVNFEYDGLNRKTKVDYPNDKNIIYTYDSETIGTLSEVQDAVGTIHYYYDQRLRRIKEERNINGIIWTTEQTYDAADRVTSRTYPSGETVNYTFNNQGGTEAVSNIIENIDYNAFGKITKKQFSNGVSTDLEYNQDDFRLNHIDTSGMQDLTYSYDNVGNVVSINDALKNKKTNFAYDDLNRLIAAQEDGGYNYSYEYSPIGNLLKLNDSIDPIEYYYGDGAGPHAVTSTVATGNQAPDKPSAPSGPSSGEVGSSYTFNTSTSDPDGDSIIYHFDWGDGNLSSWGTSSQSHSWSSENTYQVKAQAKDEHGATSTWSSASSIDVKGGNHAPNTPSTPSGPSSGEVGSSYTFSTSTTDPDGDLITYRFDWGDGIVSSWGSSSKTYNWGSDGKYYIKAQAKDEHNATSAWSGTAMINIGECSFSISPTNESFDISGGTQVVSIDTSHPDCSWFVSEDLSWVSVTPTNGSGDDNVYVTVEANIGQFRSGNLIIAGIEFNITQNSATGGGSSNWKYNLGGNIYSSPAISNKGTIYCGSNNIYLNGDKLYAIRQDGSLKWSYKTEGWIETSPSIGSDGTIYINSFICSSEDVNKLYALNPDGSLKWSYKTEGRISGSPSIGIDDIIYVGSKYGKIYAINSNGTLKWNYDTGSEVKTSPTIGRNGAIYFGLYNNKICALNSDGTFKWSYKTGGAVEDSSPAIGRDGTIYFGSEDNKFYALTPDGSLKWSYKTGDIIWSSPSIGKDGTIYFGSTDNKLYALNPDGTLKWSYKTGGRIHNTPAIGKDGTIYFGSTDNKLYALNPDGTLKWSYKAYIESDINTSSAVISNDGTIYIGSMDYYLYAIRSNSGGLANTPWSMFGHDIRHTWNKQLENPKCIPWLMLLISD